MRRQIKKIIRLTSDKARRLKQKLDKLNEKKIQHQVEAAAIRKLLRVANKHSQTGGNKFLELRQYNNEKQLASCDPLEHSLLVIRLKLLEMEVEMLEELLRRPEGMRFQH